MSNIKAKIAEARKAVAGLAGTAALLLSANLVPEPAATYVNVALGILTVWGVYQAPNAAPSEEVICGDATEGANYTEDDNPNA